MSLNRPVFPTLAICQQGFDPFRDDEITVEIPEFFRYVVLESCTTTLSGLGSLTIRLPLTGSLVFAVSDVDWLRNRWFVLARTDISQQIELITQQQYQRIEIKELLFLGKIKEIHSTELDDRVADVRITLAEVGHFFPQLILYQNNLPISDPRRSYYPESLCSDPTLFTYVRPDQDNVHFAGSMPLDGLESKTVGDVLRLLFTKTSENTKISNYALQLEIDDAIDDAPMPPIRLEPSDTLLSLLQKISPNLYVLYDYSNESLRWHIRSKIHQSGQMISLANLNDIGQLEITHQELAADAVQLLGRRILHYVAFPTLGPTPYTALIPGWTQAEADAWVNPMKIDYPCTINELDEKLKTEGEAEALEQLLRNTEKYSDTQIERAVEQYVKTAKDELLNQLTEMRKHSNVCSYFRWPGCDPTDLALPGPAAVTCRKPGDLSFLQMWQQNLASEALAAFPMVSFMAAEAADYVVTPEGLKKTENGKTTTLPFEHLDQLVRTNANGHFFPLISDAVGTHQTPNLADWRFEQRVPILVPRGNGDLVTTVATSQTQSQQLAFVFVEPRCFYRSFGAARKNEGSDTYYYDESWRSNDLQAPGSIAFRFSFTNTGIKIDSPAPEQFAWSDDAVFQIGYGVNNIFDATVYDAGEQRYKPFDVGYALARFDPDRVFYISKTHWLRLVFQVAAYSAQRVSFFVGNPITAQHPVTVVDDYFFAEIINPGFMYGLTADSSDYPEDLQDVLLFKPQPNLPPGDAKPLRPMLPFWNRHYLLVRHNLVEAFSYFRELVHYYARDRIAVRCTLPAYSATGDLYVYRLGSEHKMKLLGDAVFGRNIVPTVIAEQHFDFRACTVTISCDIPPPPSYLKREYLYAIQARRG